MAREPPHEQQQLAPSYHEQRAQSREQQRLLSLSAGRLSATIGLPGNSLFIFMLTSDSSLVAVVQVMTMDFPGQVEQTHLLMFTFVRQIECSNTIAKKKFRIRDNVP
jgi:hypothetical protein